MSMEAKGWMAEFSIRVCRWSDGIAIGALAAVSMLLFASVLFTDRVLYYGDILVTSYPYHHLWAEAIRQGQLPLWNPHVSGGSPWLADGQFSALYPTMLLNLVLPVPRAAAVELALHLWAAATFTYVLLRRMSLSPVAAFLGASTLAFSGFVIAHTQHVSMIRSLTWLPLVLLLAREISIRSWDHTVPRLAITVALTLLGGHFQIALLTVSLATLLTANSAVLVTQGQMPRLRALVRGLAILFLGVGLGGLVAAILLVPAVELAQLSVRAGGLSYEEATFPSVPRRQVLMLILPNLFGTFTGNDYLGAPNFWEMTSSVGIVAFVVAVFGFIYGRHPERWFFAAVGGGAIVLAIGRYTPVYGWLLAAIPVFRYFRVPARFFLWSSVALAVLAAYGIEWISSEEANPGSRRRELVLKGGLILAATIGLYAAVMGPGVAEAVNALQDPFVRVGQLSERAVGSAAAAAVNDIRRAGLLMAATTLIVLVVRQWPICANLAVGSIGFLLLGELYILGANYYPTAEASLLAPARPPLVLEEGAYRIARAAPTVGGFARWPSIFRAVPLSAFRRTLPPNTGMLEGIADVSGYNPIALRHVAEFTMWMWDDFDQRNRRSPLLDFLGAKYLFDPRPNRWYVPVEAKDLPIWENPNAMPRGWLVTRYEIVKDHSDMERRLRGGGGSSTQYRIPPFDPARMVLLYDAPRETFGLKARENAGQILGREYNLSRVAFELALEGSAILVLNDVYYPGWRAYVDGSEVPVYRANHAFRAIFLPSTARQVEFVFRPRSVQVGLVISVLTGLAVALSFLGYPGQSRFSRRQVV